MYVKTRVCLVEGFIYFFSPLVHILSLLDETVVFQHREKNVALELCQHLTLFRTINSLRATAVLSPVPHQHYPEQDAKYRSHRGRVSSFVLNVHMQVHRGQGDFPAESEVAEKQVRQRGLTAMLL